VEVFCRLILFIYLFTITRHRMHWQWRWTTGNRRRPTYNLNSCICYQRRGGDESSERESVKFCRTPRSQWPGLGIFNVLWQRTGTGPTVLLSSERRRVFLDSIALNPGLMTGFYTAESDLNSSTRKLSRPPELLQIVAEWRHLATKPPCAFSQSFN